MAKPKLKKLKGFVDAPDGKKYPVEMAEQPEVADPDAPPAKSTRNDLIYQGVDRLERLGPKQALAIANCVLERYGQLNRTDPEPVPAVDPEPLEWAKKVLHESLAPEAVLKRRAMMISVNIADRKAELDKKGYAKPENPEPVTDDAFEQLIAAVGLALTPLHQELAQTRAERDLARLALQNLVKDNQQLAAWQAGFSNLLALIMAQINHFKEDIGFYEQLRRYLNARCTHANASWVKRQFFAEQLPAVPPEPNWQSQSGVTDRWTKSKKLVDQMLEFMKAFPAPSDHQGQPAATNPDEVRTNIFTFPKPAVQPPQPTPQTAPPSENVPVDQAISPTVDPHRQPQTSSPDLVRTAPVKVTAAEKKSTSRPQKQEGGQPGEASTDHQRSKG
jgi:hypothetical protein